MNEESILWQVEEFKKKNNSSNWYWAVGIITIAIIIVCIMLGNTLFGIVIGLSVIILMYYTRKDPRVIEVEIGNLGIRVQDKVYLYQNLDSFHVEKFENPKLTFKSKKMWMPLIIVEMGDADPVTVEEYLSQYLTEDYHPEPFTHKLLDRIGF